MIFGSKLASASTAYVLLTSISPVKSSPLLTPSQFFSRDTGPRNADSSCNDLKGEPLQQSFWNDCKASDYLSNFLNNHQGTTSFLFDFAQPLGIGQSFSCSIPSICKRPDCNTIESPGDKGTGPAYEILVSLSNINQYLGALYDSLNMGKDRWQTLATAIEQDFWPGAPADNKGILQGLNGIQVGIGIIATLAGGPIAGVTKELVTGAARAIGINLQSADLSLKNLAQQEKAVDDAVQSYLKVLVDQNNDLLTKGQSGDLQLTDLLADGKWLDFRQIAAINTDGGGFSVSSTQLDDLFFKHILGSLISYSWRQQNTFIISYEMSQSDFDGFKANAGSNDSRMKAYYGGRGFFYQSYAANKGLIGPSKTATSQNPPGWAQISDYKLGFSDGLLSSADSFHAGGFDYKDDALDDVASSTNFQELLDNGSRNVGIWTLPHCQLAAGDGDIHNLDDLNGWLDGPGVEFQPGQKKPVYCICRDKTDQNGKKFRDYVPDADTLDGYCDYVDYDPAITY